jgi:hypothetical protein
MGILVTLERDAGDYTPAENAEWAEFAQRVVMVSKEARYSNIALTVVDDDGG